MVSVHGVVVGHFARGLVVVGALRAVRNRCNVPIKPIVRDVLNGHEHLGADRHPSRPNQKGHTAVTPSSECSVV